MKRDTSLLGANEAEKATDIGAFRVALWSLFVLSACFAVEVLCASASYGTSLSKDTFSEHVEGLVLVPLLSHMMPFNTTVVVLSSLSMIMVFVGIAVAIFYVVETDKSDFAVVPLMGVFFMTMVSCVFALSMSVVNVPFANAISKVDSVLSAQEVSYNENYRLGENATLASIADLLEDDSQVNNVLGEDVGGRVYVSEDKNHNMTVYYATNGLQSPSDLKEVGVVAQDKKNVMKSLIGGE